MNFLSKIWLVFGLTSALLLTGCNQGDQESSPEQNNGSENLEKAPVWLGISRGEVDISPEVWLPNTDKPLMDKYGESLEMHDMV